MEEIKINYEDIKEVYSYNISNGVTIIKKKNKDDVIKRVPYGCAPTLLINPKINIGENGILNIDSITLDYRAILSRPNISSDDMPIEGLVDGWKDNIFYVDENIISKRVRVGLIKKADKDYLKKGFYLSKISSTIKISTSNFRIIGYDSKVTKGLINCSQKFK